MTVQEYLEEKRIRDETLEDYGVQVGEHALIFKTSGGVKSRLFDINGRRFAVDGHLGLFWPTVPSYLLKNTAFLVEGESDTLRLHQVFKDNDYDALVVGLPGAYWHEGFGYELKEYDTVYVVLDNDSVVPAKQKVDDTWARIKSSLGAKAKRIRLPEEIKDVCDYLDRYDLSSFTSLIQKSQEGAFHYQALDLSGDVPPADWLIDGLFCRGDVSVLAGEPSVGKSLLCASISLAVASGNEWAEFEVQPGKVLYVDEENPIDVVYDRLRRMGMDDEVSKNIRYLHNQGVKLDKNADLLLEEAIAWKPHLIVLDSLQQLHGQDENNAGEMGLLFKLGIQPLAREINASVILLHHTTKSEIGGFFQKVRGSGAITASVDAGYSLQKSSGNNLLLSVGKSRRGRISSVVLAFKEGLDGDIALERVHSQKEMVY